MEQAYHRKQQSDFPEITERFIDLEKVFRSKSPRLAKLIPGFFFTYLRKVIHEKEMNHFIYISRDLWGLQFVNAALEMFRIETIVINQNNIPASGRYVIAANHPLGGMEGMALMQVAGKVRQDIVFPVNDLLMNIPNLCELFIPINKHGSNAENIRLFNDTFASDVFILYFPAGLVSRKQSGQIRDLEWKKTFLTKAVAYKRDIIPVHIAGRNSDFFYNLSNLRKRLGIKANIEMLYLVDEMYNLKDKKIRITFGQPIPYQVFDKRKNDLEWAATIKEHVYQLENEPDKKFIYSI